MAMANDTIPKLAVLIDADNARAAISNPLLSEIAKFGTAHVKRAYGDWTSTGLKGWKDELLKQSIQPIQQFAYTHGKNATDSAMIIDAMDLLYSNRFDGFCLVSSDSDFTRLAARIRESGLTVYGLGERHTPKPFVAACDKFIYTENLIHLEELLPHKAEVPQDHPIALHVQENGDLADQLRISVEAASGDDGWARLSNIGHFLTKKYPDFDSRTYGYSKLSDLVNASSLFETARHSSQRGLPGEVWVRDKRRRRKSYAE